MVQILLAESDRPIRQFMAGILTDFGHDVTVCQDGAEAAALLAIGPIDVLITDLVLRDGEGSTLSRHCAARGAGICVSWRTTRASCIGLRLVRCPSLRLKIDRRGRLRHNGIISAATRGS